MNRLRDCIARFHLAHVTLIALLSFASCGYLIGAHPALAQIAVTAGIRKAPLEMKAVLPAARVQYAAPAVGDLDHDRYLEIVVGATDGRVYAVKPDSAAGTLLWSFDTSAALNGVARNPSATTVRGAPLIADLDRDGWNEVVVTIGTTTQENQNGGIVVITHDGRLATGWPQLTFAKYSDYTDGIATPATVADLDSDGDLEIIAGSFDNRVHAWHHDGRVVAGWPQHVFDTVWSSPAIGDLDRDGLPEVIVGVDAHYSSYFGSIDGGALYVFRADGSLFPGFPVYVAANFESYPALADLNGDGYLDIIIGGGSYYDHGSAAYKVHAFDRFGHYLPGWPVSTAGHVTGSPGIADINNDGALEVVVGDWSGLLYAWHSNGMLVAGWPMRPRVYTGVNYTSLAMSGIMADMDAATNANGNLEIFINSGWEIVIVNAQGQQVTWDGSDNNAQNKYTYFTEWTINATPAIADVDGDGKLELIAAGGDGTNAQGGNATIYMWQLSDSNASARRTDWPMIKHDAKRTGNLSASQAYDAEIVSHTIPDQLLRGRRQEVRVTMRNTGTTAWSGGSIYLSSSGSTAYFPARVNLPSGTTVNPQQTATFTFTITAPGTTGYIESSWRLVRDGDGPFGQKISRKLKVGGALAFYVLRAATQAQGGGIYTGGDATPIAPPSGYIYWERATAFKLTPDKSGYFLLDHTGFVMWAGTAPDVGSVSAAAPALDLALGPDGQEYYVINDKGQLWASGAALPITPPPPTFDDGRMRSLDVTPDYRGVYVLDKFGNVYTGGTATPLSPATPVFDSDLALRIKLTKSGNGYYVLDRYGRLHAGGAASPMTPNYTLHIGEDWARDFALTEDERGYFLLDKFGGLHTGGIAPSLPADIGFNWPDGTASRLQFADSKMSPHLAPQADGVSVMAEQNGPKTYVEIALDNQGTEDPLRWTARLDPPWNFATLTPDAGTTPATIRLSWPNNLTQGTYRSTLRFTATDIYGAPVPVSDIPVTLVIAEKVYSIYLPGVLRP